MHVRKQKVFPKNPMEPFNMLTELWNGLPDRYFRNLVTLMPRRIEMVLKNKGGSKKY